MKRLLFLCFFLLATVCVAYGDDEILDLSRGNEALDFYKSIPQYDKITLSCNSGPSITINPDYTVTFSGSDHDSYQNGYLKSSGTLIWDKESNSLYLKMDVNVSGNYYRTEDVIRTESETNHAAKVANALFGTDFNENKNVRRVYDHTEYYKASGSESYNGEKLNLKLSPGDAFELSRKTYSARLTGSYSTSVSFTVGGNGAIIYGKKNSSQATKDEFGRWQWNDEHTRIWINPINIAKDTFVINIDSNKIVTLMLCFGTNEVSGETTEGNVEMFSFKFGETEITLSFVKEGTYYRYATYNRFLNQWNYDATSIVDQITSQTEMMLEYTEDGSSKKTAIYELEGLELIMGYIKAQ